MTKNITNILFSNSLNLWNLFLSQQDKGLKKESNKSLTLFIEEIKKNDKKTVQEFVYFLTDEHRTENLKIDFKLFENVIFPLLISEIKVNKTTANRRIAQFDQFLLPANPLFSNLKEQLDYKNSYFEPSDFYQKEIELNKTDLIAIEGLLNRIAQGLNYATHELPNYGLLWEVDPFKKEIQRFKNYLELYPKKEIWSSRIQHWEFVLETWKTYVNKANEFDNYKDYLSNKKIEFID